MDTAKDGVESALSLFQVPFDEVSATIRRTMLTVLGYSFFCFLNQFVFSQVSRQSPGNPGQDGGGWGEQQQAQLVWFAHCSWPIAVRPENLKFNRLELLVSSSIQDVTCTCEGGSNFKLGHYQLSTLCA